MYQPSRIFTLLRERILSGHESSVVSRGAVAVSARSLATAKGKKVIAPKKPAVKKAGSGKGKKAGGSAEESVKHPSHRFNSLLESALDAPTPLRYLKPKEKLRELELEKLGIVSKDKQKGGEKDQEKAKGKAEKKSKAQKGKGVAEERLPGKEEQIPVKLGDTNVAPELTPDEAARLAKAYSQYMMRAERARAAAETVRLQLKKEAIEALPLHLQAAARLPDLTPFPLGRVPASLSPPVGGYVEELALNAQRAASMRKSR